MAPIEPPDPKAKLLLRVIVEAIHRGRIHEGDPHTFLTYSEALELLGRPSPSFYSGSRLKKAGLLALDEWTRRHEELPKIAALIVTKRFRMPGKGFPESHGRHSDDSEWTHWWMKEANRAINYDWKPYVGPMLEFHQPGATRGGLSVREDEKKEPAAFQEFIVVEPPPAHIRKSRITVGDILHWLADGQSEAEILRQHTELRIADIRASLAYAEDSVNRVAQIGLQARKIEPTASEQPGVALPVPDANEIQQDSKNAWVSVEKYLTGKVIDSGSEQESNVHLLLADSGETVAVSAAEQQLNAEKENLLCETVTLRVQAEQHLRTGTLRNIRLIQFLPHSGEADERALENLWKKGRQAWGGVSSATGWVEALRGNS